jgi:ribosomal protein S18 acetylase RimI-like enzyme
MKSSSDNSPDLVVREFRIEDYDAVIALWDGAQLPYRSKGRDSRHNINLEIKRGNDTFLVAEVNGRVVGSVLGTHDGRKGWINRLAVDAEFQRQNIARKLVAEVESRLSELGIEVIACLIEERNITSMHVFERLGYEKYPYIAYYSKRKSKEA